MQSPSGRSQLLEGQEEGSQHSPREGQSDTHRGGRWSGLAGCRRWAAGLKAWELWGLGLGHEGINHCKGPWLLQEQLRKGPTGPDACPPWGPCVDGSRVLPGLPPPQEKAQKAGQNVGGGQAPRLLLLAWLWRWLGVRPRGSCVWARPGTACPPPQRQSYREAGSPGPCSHVVEVKQEGEAGGRPAGTSRALKSTQRTNSPERPSTVYPASLYAEPTVSQRAPTPGAI